MRKSLLKKSVKFEFGFLFRRVVPSTMWNSKIFHWKHFCCTRWMKKAVEIREIHFAYTSLFGVRVRVDIFILFFVAGIVFFLLPFPSWIYESHGCRRILSSTLEDDFEMSKFYFDEYDVWNILSEREINGTQRISLLFMHICEKSLKGWKKIANNKQQQYSL